ncbi:MAG: tocopherol cyclase family protein [Melioribacteraceae bacterium]|nr:tocopherol cyclase family protein [Melioribacteraceae bacterium]MCF8354903.1 tocopherol cyclase family protein [Melioribacteraceae bacterium]MCF8396040.1 tocopherol cyclase family protein [Melioribacteraceae bacterium]MCF8421061.1 tocopherol cyclase family protein [Melioribacteraceae bacterium]
MINFLKNIYEPECFHGHNRNDDFFEGWFFKLVDKSGDNVLAIIPGVFISKDETKHHAFIQILDGKTHESHYVRFAPVEFTAAENSFNISIEQNQFSLGNCSLNIKTQNLELLGEISFEDLKPWPVKTFSPGIMGWYSFVPFMECNHGVLSLDHSIKGTLRYNGKSINFNGGKGYIEKDWGSAFPSSYVWKQSNHFENRGVSFTGSVARIPWLKSWFRGFIVGLLVDEKLYRFATYTGAKLMYLHVDDQKVKYEIDDNNYHLTVEAARKNSGILHAPYEKQMLERISESLDSEVHVKLLDKKENRLIFEGTGKHAGLDVNGNLKEIADNID